MFKVTFPGEVSKGLIVVETARNEEQAASMALNVLNQELPGLGLSLDDLTTEGLPPVTAVLLIAGDC